MVYSAGMSPEARERRQQASLLWIEGTGWDIGLAVRFLLSEEARYITGQTLVVDGGATLAGPSRFPDSRWPKEHTRMARLSYLDKEDLAEDDQDLLSCNINLFRAMVHSPKAARAIGRMGAFIRGQSQIDGRLRELAILQVGYSTRTEYEYSHHIEIGRGFGVSDDDIRALAEDTAGRATDLVPVAKAVLRAAREMPHALAVSEETFDALRQELADECLVDLLVTIAYYNALVRLLATLQIDVEDEYRGYLREFPLPQA